MNERITLISLFNEDDIEKINNVLGDVTDILCKVPFGKNVDDRFKVDTLPHHFTIFSWNIEKEKEVINFLKNISFEKFKILVDKIIIVEGNEGSFDLRFNIENNESLYNIQKTIFNEYSSKYYVPDNFNFHITIHIDKDYEKVLQIKKQIEKKFSPFTLTIKELGLFEIYPAKLVKTFKSN